MIDLGYTNGWRDTPEEVKKCRENKHQVRNTPDIRFRCVRIIYCPICDYQYRVDSSD